MSASLAQKCRDEPLKLSDQEDKIRWLNINQPAYTCQRDAFLGLFFDGTNNNKYRDLPTHSASNVARLFEAFSGNVAKLTATYGGKPDQPLPEGVADGVYGFHRKIYIPGLGTGFPEVNDPGENLSWWRKVKQNKVPTLQGDKTRGLAMAMYGEARIRWALLQVLEQVHFMFKGTGLIPAAEITRWASHSQEDSLLKSALKLIPLYGSGMKLMAFLAADFDEQFAHYLAELNKKISAAERKKIRAIRMSIFGFSRGAAEARAFTNRLQQLAPSSLGGVPYQVDFMGIFDTVAAVGLANLTPGADGHMAWADGDALKVPSSVKRCVHLVAAHEIRRCFPLDSIAGGAAANYLEVVYPGVHSDVGGGYPPLDQGRCLNDSDKISQISLAQMYREARMAGVPLIDELGFKRRSYLAKLFEVSPDLIKVFNAYIERSRDNKKPAKSLRDIVLSQYKYYLVWRRYHLGENSLLKVRPARLNDSSVENKYEMPSIRTVELEQPQVKPLNSYSSITRRWLSGSSTEAQDKYDMEQTQELLRNVELAKVRPHQAVGRSLWFEAHFNPKTDQPLLDLFDCYVHDSRAWFKLAGATDDEWYGGGKDANGKVRPSLRDAEWNKEQARLDRLKANRTQAQKRTEEMKARRAKSGSYFELPGMGGAATGTVETGQRGEDIEIAQSEARLRKMNEKWNNSGGKPLINNGEASQEGIDFEMGKITSLDGAGYLTMRDIYFGDGKAAPTPKQKIRAVPGCSA